MALRQALRRVDVFTASGGFSRTTLAILLARLQSRHAAEQVSAKHSAVLMIDADITGPCLGDRFLPEVEWPEQDNLTHLICDRPELLPEHLTDEHLPIYHAQGEDARPVRLAERYDNVSVLFCPSHARSLLPGFRRTVAQGRQVVNPVVLHALLGHESAGGWISEVIEQVIERTDQFLWRHGGSLAGVIVDHGATFGALPNATLTQSAHDEGRRVLLVSKLTRSELLAARQVDEHINVLSRPDPRNHGEGPTPLYQRTVRALNKVPKVFMERDRWKEEVQRYLRGEEWEQRTFPIPTTEEARIVDTLDLSEPDVMDQALSPVRASLFD